ncbi:MAG: FG-GAP-like repeat-containing protein, partial [Nitrospirales bacterium]
MGDLNGDGILDLARISLTYSGIGILLGKGDGTFQSGNTPDFTGSENRSIAIGDVNGDGRADLVISSAGLNGVSILIGRGDGSFASALFVGASLKPGFVAMGDFNGDGNPDLGVLNPSLGVISVLLNGCGSSCASIAFSPNTPALPNGVTGTSYIQTFTASGGTAPYRFNVADGSLPPGLSLSSTGPLSGTPTAFGSFWFSIVVLDANNCPASRTYSIFIAGPPTVTTGTATLVTSGAAKLTGIVIENGLTATASFQWGTTTSYGNVAAATKDYSSGQFFANLSGLAAATVYHYRSAATNSAGTSYGGDLTFSTLPGTACPYPYFATPRYASGGVVPRSFVAGDFNGDGKSDLASINYGDARLYIKMGNGDGTFSSQFTYNTPSGGQSTYIAASDFNGDGKLDIVTGDSNGISVWIGKGDGGFSPRRDSNINIRSDFPSIAIGDFNGDGKMDLVHTNYYSNVVTILLGDETGLFSIGGAFNVRANPIYVATGDLNRDGKLDLVTANGGSNDLSIFFGNGDGTFQPEITVNTGSLVYSLGVKDFNGDGNMDLAVANYSSDSVSILLGNGDGSFRAPVSYPVGGHPYSVASADFNGDGILDLVVANYSTNDAAVLLGNGNGTFEAPYFFDVGYAPTLIVPADFNGDGRLDLAAFNYLQFSISVLLNFCGSNCPALSISPISLPTGRVGIPYNQPLTATGGSGPYTFTLFTSNLLPAGLTLDTSGLISGSPTAVVSRRFTVLASDPNQCSASRTYQMTVDGIPSVTTQNASDVTSNSAKLKGNVFSSYLPTTSY